MNFVRNAAHFGWPKSARWVQNGATSTYRNRYFGLIDPTATETLSQEVNSMEHGHEVEFKHRPRTDGLFDSICLSCFHTVGTTDAEPELRALELSQEPWQRIT